MANYNTENIFWEEYSELKVMEPFATFYEKDTTKSKTGSSKIMWAITLAERHDSEWYNLPDKYAKLASDFLKKDINWDHYEDLIVQYKSTQITQAERSLSAWNEMMSKRDKYLKKQHYHFDEEQTVINEQGEAVVKFVKGTAEQLDKAYSVTPKMYAEYEKIRKLLEEEKNTQLAVDGRSLSAQKLI